MEPEKVLERTHKAKVGGGKWGLKNSVLTEVSTKC